jgi:DUF1680 family protein
VAINGKPHAGKVAPNTYLALKRTWKPGDVVTLSFDMAVKLVSANPRVPETYGKAAVQRGPFLYCLEQPDLVGASVFDVALSGSAFKPMLVQNMFRSPITALVGQGLMLASPATGAPLYTYGKPLRPGKPVRLTLIPYFSFHNRSDAPFTVWMPLVAPSAPATK